MATTTIGQPRTATQNTISNKAIYWGIAAVLAILFIFAFTANRNASVVTPTTQRVETSPAWDTTPTLRDSESAPAMDSNPNTTAIIPPEMNVAPSDTTTTNNGVFVQPVLPPNEQMNSMEPGTAKDPQAPMGTVER